MFKIHDYIHSLDKPSNPLQGMIKSRLFTSGIIWYGDASKKFSFDWWSSNKDTTPREILQRYLNERNIQHITLNFEKTDGVTNLDWEIKYNDFVIQYKDRAKYFFTIQLGRLKYILDWYKQNSTVPIGKFKDIIPPSSFVNATDSKFEWESNVHALNGEFFNEETGEFQKENEGIFDGVDFHAPSLYLKTDSVVHNFRVMDETLRAYREIIKSDKPIYPFISPSFRSGEDKDKPVHPAVFDKILDKLNVMFDGICIFERRHNDYFRRPYWHRTLLENNAIE